jgi:hypothetical protein
MKNVTISMDEDTLGWVRIEAARSGQSVSRWIGERLQGMNSEDAAKAAAAARIKAFLNAGPRFDLSEGGKLIFDRDEVHDDGRFRRFDDPSLHAGYEISDEAERLRGVAESSSGHEAARPQSSGPERNLRGGET